MFFLLFQVREVKSTIIPKSKTSKLYEFNFFTQLDGSLIENKNMAYFLYVCCEYYDEDVCKITKKEMHFPKH